jgi:galactokinase
MDFLTLFGRSCDVRAKAAGRVNLMGEHTDYNGGLVLPTAIPQHTRAEIARRADSRVRAWSRERADEPIAEFELGHETRGRGWLDYVQGVTTTLTGEGFAVAGFDVRIESDVPVGAGLSSSAALEVALLRGLREVFAHDLDDVALALLAQRGENRFVGAPVGIMDPLASSLARPGAALLIDTSSLAVKPVALPAELELLVISSGIAHEHRSGGYRTRRAECERAAERLGVETLSELSAKDLERAAALPEPLGRRVRHVVTENARVRETAAAFESGDTRTVGSCFAASHASMRDDYEVSTPEIDRLVGLAVSDRDVVAARLTGGGFGGSIVALARSGAASAAGRRIARACGGGAEVLVPNNSRM